MEAGVSRHAVVAKRPRVVELCTRVDEALGCHGPVMVQREHQGFDVPHRRGETVGDRQVDGLAVQRPDRQPR